MNRSLSRSLAIIAVGSTLPPVRHTRSYLSSPTPTRTSCRETGLNGSTRNTASDIGSYERHENDFDKTLAITSDLQKKLDYDTEVESPLTPSTDLKRFVFVELPGSAIDFASTLTRMARSAGLQSRVATGCPVNTTPTPAPVKLRRTTLMPGRKSTSVVPVGFLSTPRPVPICQRLPISSRPRLQA